MWRGFNVEIFCFNNALHKWWKQNISRKWTDEAQWTKSVPRSGLALRGRPGPRRPSFLSSGPAPPCPGRAGCWTGRRGLRRQCRGKDYASRAARSGRCDSLNKKLYSFFKCNVLKNLKIRNLLRGRKIRATRQVYMYFVTKPRSYISSNYKV